MRKLIFVSLFLVSLAARGADSIAWETWEDCHLETEKYFDGDSFHVRHGREVTIIRLYFVDTPETDEGYGGRLAEQAAYFHVNTRTVLRAGHTAREFTAKFLASPFRVITRRQLAPGASRDQRYYGIVESSHGRLDAALIGAGLARTTSEIADYPDTSKGRQTALDFRLSGNVLTNFS